MRGSECEVHPHLKSVMIPSVLVVKHQQRVFPSNGYRFVQGDVNATAEEQIGTVFVVRDSNPSRTKRNFPPPTERIPP